MRKLQNEELNRLTVEEFKNEKKIPLVVVLDNVRSCSNIGSVFRTSDAFKVECIYLCGITATPPNKEIHKTALGATESVDWKYAEKTENVVDVLKKSGYKVFGIEQAEKSISLEKMDINDSEKYAIIFGHEVKGVAQEVVDMCDEVIELPQYGTKHSLNISVCAGIVIWEFFRKIV